MVLCGDSFNYGIGCDKAMNERILEIAKQANVLADFGDDITVGRYSIGGSYEQMEQFAELIVKECVNVVDGGSFLHDQAPTAIFAKECSAAIKRHFDIK